MTIWKTNRKSQRLSPLFKMTANYQVYPLNHGVYEPLTAEGEIRGPGLTLVVTSLLLPQAQMVLKSLSIQCYNM